jgi:hypothetical protein
MKNFWKSFFIILLFSFASHAASVRTASQVDQLDFGLIGPGDDSGTIGILSGAGICSSTTNEVVSFGGCSDGSFTLLTRNGNSSVALNNGKQKFRVHVSQFATTITANDTEILFPSIAGCVASSSPNPPAGFIAIDCENTSTANNAQQTWIIPVIAKISNISATQTSTTFNPSYSFIACRCNKGCPSSVTSNKCKTNNNNNRGVTLTPNFLAQIYKSLSITSQTDLDFGRIAAGSEASTIRQTGNKLTGNAARIDEGSAGGFTVQGESGGTVQYDIDLPTSVTLDCTSGSCGSSDMSAALEFSSGGTPVDDSLKRTLDASGNDVIDVEGILSVGANQLQGDYSLIMKNFLKLFTIILLFSFQGNAASVRAASQANQLNFGQIGPGDSLGSIGGSTNPCSPTSGGVVSISGCMSFGSFDVTARNQGNNVPLPIKNTFRVFLETPITTISTGDTELFFENIAACTNMPSPPAGTIAMDCTNNSTANNAQQDWNIKVYGKISNISETQSSATYSPAYRFAGCRCNNGGCAPNIDQQKCSGNNRGVTVSTTLNAQIYKNLSFSVSPTDLDFGKIAAGNASSTFGQTGNALSGNAARIEGGSAGTFTINGESGGGINYNLTLPASVSLECPSCGGSPMNVGLEFYSGLTEIFTGTRTLDASGDDEIDIEGILSVGANQAEGNYSGTYSITINY